MYATHFPLGGRHLHGRGGTGVPQGLPADITQSPAPKRTDRPDHIRKNGASARTR